VTERQLRDITSAGVDISEKYKQKKALLS
jgi:hypothetical protein